MRLTFSRVAYPYPSPSPLVPKPKSPSAEMVAILNELRKERRTRWVRRQQNRVSKVLLIGLYKDQDSPLKMLRTPNNVVNEVMSIVWDYLTWRWQVYDETPTTENVQEQKFKEKNCLIL